MFMLMQQRILFLLLIVTPTYSTSLTLASADGNCAITNVDGSLQFTCNRTEDRGSCYDRITELAAEVTQIKNDVRTLLALNSPTRTFVVPTIECTGSPVPLGAYLVLDEPFNLSMTVKWTSPPSDGNGGIFKHRVNSHQRLEVQYDRNGLHLQACSSSNWDRCENQGDVSAALSNTWYTVQIMYSDVESSTVSWNVNGVQQGAWQLQHSEGLGISEPTLCYSGSGGIGGWTGTISDLRFEGHFSAKNS